MTKNADDDFVTEQMLVTRRRDSRYSKSHTKPGEFSPLTRNDEAELHHVTLRPLDDGEQSEASSPEPGYIYDHSFPPYEPEPSVAEVLGQIVVRALLELAIAHGTPHAKRIWAERLSPAIKARAGRGRDRLALRRARRDTASGALEVEILEPAEPPAEVADVTMPKMGSSEARARVLLAIAAQRFAEEQMRLVGDAEIVADAGVKEVEHALAELPPEQVSWMLEQFQANPALIAGDALTGLGMLFGVERPDARFLELGADGAGDDAHQKVVQPGPQ